MAQVEKYYFGSYPTVLDEAGRMNAPRRIRETMESAEQYNWFITPGLNGNLYLYHKSEWEKLLERNQPNFESMDQRTHQFFSFGYGFTAETRVDRQGRMPIPSHLRESFGIEREVVLVGVQNRLELWNKSAWDAFVKSMWPVFGQRATELATVNGSEKGGDNNGNSADGHGTSDGASTNGGD